MLIIIYDLNLWRNKDEKEEEKEYNNNSPAENQDMLKKSQDMVTDCKLYHVLAPFEHV